jgi:hypothetical protein
MLLVKTRRIIEAALGRAHSGERGAAIREIAEARSRA